MGAGLLLLAGLALLAAAAGGSRRRAGGVTAQTRARVRETLATPDARAAAIPVEPAPAPVDPDRSGTAPRSRSSRGGSRSSRDSSSGSAWSRRARDDAAGADMAFTPDAAGRMPHEPGYVDPGGPPSSRATGAGADMTFAPDAAGRSPHEAGYIDPASASSTAGLIVEPPDTGTEGADAPEAAGEAMPEEARRLASSTASSIRSRSSGWRNRLRAFQRAAGIAPDGRYGGLTHNALIYYGIRNPPAATSAPRASSPSANYVDRVIARPEGVA